MFDDDNSNEQAIESQIPLLDPDWKKILSRYK